MSQPAERFTNEYDQKREGNQGKPGSVNICAPTKLDTRKAMQPYWQEHKNRLRAYIAKQVDEPANVDDILQDVYIKVIWQEFSGHFFTLPRQAVVHT